MSLTDLLRSQLILVCLNVSFWSFQEWAIHCKRFNEKTDEPDYPTWKTRLRCAMNKNGDIIEIKKHSRTDIKDAYKVYQFLPGKTQYN